MNRVKSQIKYMIALDTCCVSKCSGDCWAECPVPSDRWFRRLKKTKMNRWGGTRKHVYWEQGNMFTESWSSVIPIWWAELCLSSERECHAWSPLITQVLPGVLIQDTYHPWKQSTPWVTRNFCGGLHSLSRESLCIAEITRFPVHSLMTNCTTFSFSAS